MNENTRTITTIDHTGDTKYTWDRNNLAECEAAREHFNAMRKKGFLVFKVKFFLFNGKQVEEFNPKDGSYKYVQEEPQTEVARDLDMKSVQVKPQTEVAREFDPDSNYIVSPPVIGG